MGTIVLSEVYTEKSQFPTYATSINQYVNAGSFVTGVYVACFIWSSNGGSTVNKAVGCFTIGSNIGVAGPYSDSLDYVREITEWPTYNSSKGNSYRATAISVPESWSITLDSFGSNTTTYNNAVVEIIDIIDSKYPITYSSSNSTVSGPSEAAVGDTVTVSAVPDVGYGITDASMQILVTNNDVAVPYTWDAANNRITFTMPDPS